MSCYAQTQRLRSKRLLRRMLKVSGHTADDLARLKKSFGDWHYQGFNLDYEEWDERWRPISQSIDDYVFADEADEEEVGRFLSELIRTCSFVLLELEKSGVLGQLNQEPGFYTQCIDHDENEILHTSGSKNIVTSMRRSSRNRRLSPNKFERMAGQAQLRTLLSSWERPLMADSGRSELRLSRILNVCCQRKRTLGEQWKRLCPQVDVLLQSSL